MLTSTAALVIGALGHPAAFGDTQRHPTPAARGQVAAPVKVPGDLTGLGFDSCAAPSQAAMDDLRTESPYWAVGVYIGGETRTCAQPELTRTWVSRQHHRGWSVIAIWAGLQAPKVGGSVRSADARTGTSAAT